MIKVSPDCKFLLNKLFSLKNNNTRLFNSPKLLNEWKMTKNVFHECLNQNISSNWIQMITHIADDLSRTLNRYGFGTGKSTGVVSSFNEN